MCHLNEGQNCVCIVRSVHRGHSSGSIIIPWYPNHISLRISFLCMFLYRPTSFIIRLHMSLLLPLSSYGTSTPVTILRSNRIMSTKPRCLVWIGILSQRMRLYLHHGIIRSRFVLPYHQHLFGVSANVPRRVCVCVCVCVLRKGVVRRVSCP